MERHITINATTKLVTEICCNCGVMFAIPYELQQQLLQKRGPNGKRFYCPNGHNQYYVGKSDAQRAKELEEQLHWSRTRNRGLEDQLEMSERSKAAYKGHLTRTKKRVGNGVCPCCNRTFQNLHDHMKTQHPEYTDSESDT